MMISNNGIELIKQFESLRLKAYLCPAEKWTIGYSHIRNVIEGDVINKEVTVYGLVVSYGPNPNSIKNSTGYHFEEYPLPIPLAPLLNRLKKWLSGIMKSLGR